MLIATWWGVGVAALFGLSGLVVGVVGLVQAARARSTAADANQIAKDANTVARRANSFAEEANGIARDANSLAGEANTIAKGEAEKAGELHRIDWELNWDTPGRYRVENLGPDTAHDVRAQITVDDETVVGEASSLAKGQAIILEFPGALAEYKRERALEAAEERRKRELESNNLFGAAHAMTAISSLGALHGLGHYIRDLVTWRSPAGNPHKHDKAHPGSSLGGN